MYMHIGEQEGEEAATAGPGQEEGRGRGLEAHQGGGPGALTLLALLVQKYNY